MAEIKVKPKGTIKKLEKEIVQVQKFKNNLITVKEKINEFSTNDNNTAENYASQKIQNDISYISRKGAVKINEIGKKSLKETQENFIKGKQKVEILKSRIKELFNIEKLNTSDMNYLVNSRSLAILKNCNQILDGILDNIDNDFPIDMLEIDIKEVWNLLGSIIGETYEEELLDNLFSRFCLGK